METSGDPVELRLPPKPEYVGTARIVVAALARQSGFGEEQIDDLKIAVSEAVTTAINEQSREGSGVVLRLTMTGDELRVEVDDLGSGIARSSDADGPDGALGLAVIRSLFAETMITQIGGNGTRLTFICKREAEPAGSMP